MARSALAIASCLASAPACLGLRVGQVQNPYGGPSYYPQAAYLNQQAAYPQAAYQQAYPQGYPQAGYQQASYQQAYQQQPFQQAYQQQPFQQAYPQAYPQAAYQQAYYPPYAQSPFPSVAGPLPVELPFEVKEAPGLVEGVKNLTRFVKKGWGEKKVKIDAKIEELKPTFKAIKEGTHRTMTAFSDLKMLARKNQTNVTMSDEQRERVADLRALGKQVFRNVGQTALLTTAMDGDKHLERSSPLERAAYKGMATLGVWTDRENKVNMTKVKKLLGVPAK